MSTTPPRAISGHLAFATALLVLLLAVVFVAACDSSEPVATTGVSTDVSDPSGTSSATAGGSPPAIPEPPPEGPTPPSTAGGPPISTSPSSGGATDPAESLAELEQLVSADPANAEALERLGAAYYKARQYEKAEAAYLSRLELGDSAGMHNNLGNVYRDWGKKEQAIAQYQKAIELDPALAFPYSNLASLHMMSGQMEQAFEIVRSGIEMTSGAGREQLQALLKTLEQTSSPRP